MDGIEKIVTVVHVVNVAIVIVRPIRRPGLREFKPISAVLEARFVIHNYRMADMEVMLATEVSAEFVVWNALTVGRLLIVIVVVM